MLVHMKKQTFDLSKDWQQSVMEWEINLKNAKKIKPLKGLSSAKTKIISISRDTAKNLKWKSFKWVIKRDETHEIKKGFLLLYGIIS